MGVSSYDNPISTFCSQNMKQGVQPNCNPIGICDEGDQLVGVRIDIKPYQSPHFNPFKPNGISHYYQLDKPISSFRGAGWYFFSIFMHILIEYSVSK